MKCINCEREILDNAAKCQYCGCQYPQIEKESQNQKVASTPSEIEKTTVAKYIKRMIDTAVAKGSVTQKERSVILRTAKENNLDTDVVEMMLDSALSKVQQQIKAKEDAARKKAEEEMRRKIEEEKKRKEREEEERRRKEREEQRKKEEAERVRKEREELARRKAAEEAARKAEVELRIAKNNRQIEATKQILGELFCKKCGKPVAENAAFCKACGCKLK